VIRAVPIGVCVCVLAATLASCGGNRSERSAVPLPSSGRAYRSMGLAERTAVAASCRDGAAAAARGTAARQLRAIDPTALRTQLDDAFLAYAELRRPVAEVCATVVPFVTPGLRLTFVGAKYSGDGTFSIETSSNKRLAIRGRVTPPPARGRVVARREVGPRVRRVAALGADGRFALPGVNLLKLADNTFTLTIEAPPNAPRKVHFSAICLDCGGTLPSAQQE
jgi:hypothetical protein